MRKLTTLAIAAILGITTGCSTTRNFTYPGTPKGDKAEFTASQMDLYQRAETARNHGRDKEAYNLYKKVIAFGKQQPAGIVPGYKMHKTLINYEEQPDRMITDDAQFRIAMLMEKNLRENTQNCTPEQLKEFAADVRDAYIAVHDYGDSNHRRKATIRANNISKKYNIDYAWIMK